MGVACKLCVCVDVRACSRVRVLVVLLFDVTIETIVAPYHNTVARDQQISVIVVDFSTYTALNATSEKTVNSYKDVYSVTNVTLLVIFVP